MQGKAERSDSRTLLAAHCIVGLLAIPMAERGERGEEDEAAAATGSGGSFAEPLGPAPPRLTPCTALTLISMAARKSLSPCLACC